MLSFYAALCVLRDLLASYDLRALHLAFCQPCHGFGDGQCRHGLHAFQETYGIECLQYLHGDGFEHPFSWVADERWRAQYDERGKAECLEVALNFAFQARIKEPRRST